MKISLYFPHLIDKLTISIQTPLNTCRILDTDLDHYCCYNSQRDMLVRFCKGFAKNRVLCEQDHAFPLQQHSNPSLIPGIYLLHIPFISVYHHSITLSPFSLVSSLFPPVCLSPLSPPGSRHSSANFTGSFSILVHIH